MTAAPAEVSAALIPEEAAEFDQQWRAVMATATETLDLSEAPPLGLDHLEGPI